MSGKPATPEQQAEILAMTAVGYPISVIVTKTGLSPSTVSRVRRKTGVKKGAVTGELIEQARTDLYKSFRNDDGIRTLITNLLADNAAMAAVIREKTLAAIEHLNPTDTHSAAIAIRALTGASTLIKNTTDSIRVMMPDVTPDEREIPTIRVERLTSDEVSRMREEQAREEAELLGLMGDDGDDDDEIIETEMTGT